MFAWFCHHFHFLCSRMSWVFTTFVLFFQTGSTLSNPQCPLFLAGKTWSISINSCSPAFHPSGDRHPCFPPFSFTNIISNKNFVFMNFYWSDLCFYLKIKKRLNIAFHSQTDEQIELQNQILKHYLKTYVLNNQTNCIELLFLTRFVYQNSK